MQRRTFLKSTALVGGAFSNLDFLNVNYNTKMGIVVHSYAMRYSATSQSAKYPAFTDAISFIDHCAEIGSAGVQTIIKNWTDDYSLKVRNLIEKKEMYLEGSIGMPKKMDDLPQFESDIKAAKSTGAKIVRAVSLGGRRYEVFKDKASFDEYQNQAILMLQKVEPILAKHQIKLGIENHKDWTANDLALNMKNISSEWLGVTLDFGNSMALLEDPIYVATTLAPYIVSSHIKDMAVDKYQDGFLLAEVPLGKGILDLPKMISICKKYNPKVKFNLEMITRAPLQIPCLKSEYFASFSSAKAEETSNFMEMINAKKSKYKLPTNDGLSVDIKMEAEEQNILQSIYYCTKLKI